MNKVVSLLAIVLMTAFFACESGNNDKSYKIDNPNLRQVVIKEVIHTTQYTYLKMKEEGAVYWGAIPRWDGVEEGETYYYDNFMEMKNFPSKELDRTFEQVLFIQSISEQPYPAAGKMSEEKQGSPSVGDMEVEKIEPVEGGISIGELYDNKADLGGKSVKVHGKVVKFTSAVMGKNWVHIQDGTTSGDNYDVTITTSAVVNKGDVVTFEGVLALDKDFGYGYAYDILIEDASLIGIEESTSLQ